jgi:hypothetical protein
MMGLLKSNGKLIMSANFDIRALAVKVTDFDLLCGASLLIGNFPTAIIEPDRWILEKRGLVLLITTDPHCADWKFKLLPKTRGFTGDPRILKIAHLMLGIPMSPDLFPSVKSVYPGLIFDPLEK